MGNETNFIVLGYVNRFEIVVDDVYFRISRPADKSDDFRVRFFARYNYPVIFGRILFDYLLSLYDERTSSVYYFYSALFGFRKDRLAYTVRTDNQRIAVKIVQRIHCFSAERCDFVNDFFVMNNFAEYRHVFTVYLLSRIYRSLNAGTEPAFFCDYYFHYSAFIFPCAISTVFCKFSLIRSVRISSSAELRF